MTASGWPLSSKVARDQKVKELNRTGVLASLGDTEKLSVIEAIRLSRSFGFSLFEAAKEMADQSPQRKTKPLSDVVDRYCKFYQGSRKSAYTINSAIQAVTMFENLSGSRLAVGEITKEMVEAFAFRKGLAASTRNNYLRRMNTFLAWCAKEGEIDSNPTANSEKEEVILGEPGLFEPSDVRRLLDTALSVDPALLTYLAIGFFLGVRVAEIKRLQPRDINLTDNLLTVRRGKNGRKRTMKINDTARAWMKAGKPMRLENLRKRLYSVLEGAEVAWVQNGMRHSFASYHVAKYRNPGELALSMGHIGNISVLYAHYLDASITSEAGDSFWSVLPVNR